MLIYLIGCRGVFRLGSVCLLRGWFIIILVVILMKFVLIVLDMNGNEWEVCRLYLIICERGI